MSGSGSPITGRRMFVAVWPPPAVVELLAGLERPADPGLRWTTSDQWHVTLRFLGSVGDEAEACLRQRWQALDLATIGAVEAVLGPATRRFGDRILQVPVGGLEALAGAVVGATADIGEQPDPRPFAGHVTLARTRGRGADLRRWVGTPLAARWTVTEVVLVQSHTHPTGARYEVIARRPLN